MGQKTYWTAVNQARFRRPRELKMIASERGIGPSTLVRMWIKERLTQERKAS